MVDMLETWLVKMGWNGGVTLLGLQFLRSRGSFIFVIIIVAFTGEVLGSFVFVGRAKLQDRESLACMSATEREVLPTY